MTETAHATPIHTLARATVHTGVRILTLTKLTLTELALTKLTLTELTLTKLTLTKLTLTKLTLTELTLTLTRLSLLVLLVLLVLLSLLALLLAEARAQQLFSTISRSPLLLIVIQEELGKFLVASPLRVNHVNEC